MACLDSGFQRCLFALLASLGARPTGRQDVLVVVHGAQDSSVPRGQEAKQRQEGAGLAVPFPDGDQDCFLPPD